MELKNLRAIVMDCDGVLTPGDIIYDQHGNRLLRFHARDGVGIALAARAGIKLGILSGRHTDIAEQRFAEIGVTAFMGQCRDKAIGFLEICKMLEAAPEHTAFVADDVPDLAAFGMAGFKVAVANSSPEILHTADVILKTEGGFGAVREFCEMVLKAQGKWPY
jgi:3-deoxy-D-manno-octulosonate 8-phosphate phosphatase (KDO 8-P phosphatase)